MAPLESLTKLLGGRAALKTEIRTEGDLVSLVREGLPYASFEHVAKGLHMSVHEASSSLKLSRRTLGRRKEHGDRLSAQESERAVRLARLAIRAEDVLGSMEKAHRWLREPNRALGSARPIDLLDVDVGAEQVFQVLGRIEHGMYA